MSTPRKHHYLPKFYLLGFSDSREILQQVHKKTGRAFQNSIGNAGAIRDFHVLDFKGVEDPQEFEKGLSKVEGQFAVYLSRFLENGIEDEEALDVAIQLVSHLRMRVPAVKRFVDLIHSSQIQAVALQMEERGELPDLPFGIQAKDLKIEIANWKCLQVMFELAADEAHLASLRGMKATLFSAPEGGAFLTSDQPVALFHPEGGNTDYGVGPDTPGVEVSLALSSKFLLLLEHRQGGHQQSEATPDQVREFNRRAVVMGEEYLFFEPNSLSVEELLAENGDRNAGFEMDEAAPSNGSFFQLIRCAPVGPK